MADHSSSPPSFPNGTCKQHPVPTSDIRWLPQKRSSVIAIDFGTSTLALAYKLADDEEVHDLNIQEENNTAYVPTVLLINPDNTVEIGESALHDYTRQETVDVSKSLFFERVKLTLQNDKVH